MVVAASIFFEFNLPNATTWLYFSVLLAVALFFRFSRVLSVRNLDVLTLFLLVPGLLLLQQGQGASTPAEVGLPAGVARVAAGAGQAALSPAPGVSTAVMVATAAAPARLGTPRILWYGYLWLLVGSLYFFFRCLADLALVRRPALSPNLNFSGLVWLAAALLVCLVAVAVRKPAGPPGPVGKRSAAVDETQRRAEDLVKQETPAGQLDGLDTAFWVECISAIVCHLAIVLGLWAIGRKHYQDAHAGVAAATFYLLLPYTAYHVGQVHHVLPAALIVWAVVAYRRPAAAGALLGLAAGTSYFPVLLFFPWMSFYWRRGHRRFSLAFLLSAGLCLAVIGAVLWTNGELARSVESALSLSDWQPWKQPNPQTKGFWTGVAWAPAYRLPVFIAFSAFVLATRFWPTPKNLAQVVALSAAILIGIQFWFADQGGVYVLWYLPLLLLLVFRPNLSDREAPPIAADTDWLAHSRHWLGRKIGRLFRRPDTLAGVS